MFDSFIVDGYFRYYFGASGKPPAFTEKINFFICADRALYCAVIRNLAQDEHRNARGYRHRCHRRAFYVVTQQVTLLLIKALTKTEKAQMALKARGFRAD